MNLQARVYYFTNDSTLQEMIWNPTAPSFSLGGNFGPVVKGSVTLYATVDAEGDAVRQFRLGYQCPSNPTTITERIFMSSDPAGWSTRIYPDLMN